MISSTGTLGALGVCLMLALAGSAHAAEPSLPTPLKAQDAYQCGAHCAVPSAGSYPHIVIGVFASVASDTQSAQLFEQARAKGYWSALPASSAQFTQTLLPVAISLDGQHVLPVVMAQDEYRAARPMPGDLVRYSPHWGVNETPPTDAIARAFWDIDGCVAVICRAGDKACFARYPHGVFRFKDGVAVSPQTSRALPGVLAINPQSLLPISVANPQR